MQEENDKRNKKGNWIKAMLGLFFLSWDIFKKEKVIEKRENPPKKVEETYLEKHIKPINTNKQMDKDADKEKEGWLKAQPEKLPEPTYWPFFLALGLVFIFWGILTTWIIFSVGLLIFIIALTGWINILRHE